MNNAGITRDTLLLRMTDEQWDEVLNVNLRSIFVACRAAIRPKNSARNLRPISSCTRRSCARRKSRRSNYSLTGVDSAAPFLCTMKRIAFAVTVELGLRDTT